MAHSRNEPPSGGTCNPSRPAGRDRGNHGWEDYRGRVTAKALAETQGARLVKLDRAMPFPDRFPEDEAVRTRLGENGNDRGLSRRHDWPFRKPVTSVALPVHWSRGLHDQDIVELAGTDSLVFRVGRRGFLYDATGLQRMESTSS